jgi:molybdopterin-binding protein
MELSARNQLPGKVTNVQLGGIMAQVTIDVPARQTIVAAITRESAEQLGLTAGDDVTAIIKSTEVLLGK